MAKKETNDHLWTATVKVLSGWLQVVTFLRPANKKAGETEPVQMTHTIKHKPFELSEKAWKAKHNITHVGKAYRAINKDGSHNSQMHEAPSKLARQKERFEIDKNRYLKQKAI